MRGVQFDLHAKCEVSIPRQDVLEGVQVSTDDRDAAHEAYLTWQQHMRGALWALPTAYGQWIWKPPMDVQQKAKQMDLFGE